MTSSASLILWAGALLAFGPAARAWAERLTERHLRLEAPQGAVHVWMPPGYDPSTAATVVYVHGYFVDVDTAWQRYRLRDQFHDSGINALFIACESPRSEQDPVSWSSLHALLDLAHTATPPPSGRLVAIGHSGAHRTLSRWLENDRLDTVVLIDAAYGELAPYATWLDSRRGRRLIDVGDITLGATDAFHGGLPDSVVIDGFPSPRRGSFPEPVRDARVVYVRSRMGHMELVTRGVAIPMLLRALSASLLPGFERSAPLRTI